ncbi:MAG: ArsR/SmtB family transcription factor [Haloarculaceae archaeon]
MTDGNGWDPKTVFEVLGCPTARRILALGAIQPCSAEEMTERCDASKPTVYRRLNVLREYDLLVERRAIDDSGTHYKTYETVLDEVRVGVEPGAFEVDIELTRDVFDGDPAGELDEHTLASGPGPTRNLQ